MKIALISDVHGNYPAMDTVLADAAKCRVDSYVFVGDYIFDNPFPNEVTDRLRLMPDATIIQGNKEGYLEGMQRENQNTWKYDQLAAMYWTYQTLTEENRRYLMNLPREAAVSLGNGNRLYTVHFIEKLERQMTKTDCSSSRYAARMKRSPFTHEEYLREMEQEVQARRDMQWLPELHASVIVTGHTHLQWHFRLGDILWVNPGSCGQPLDFDPRAPYSILDIQGDAISVEERRVPYDLRLLSEAYQSSGIRSAAPVWTALIEKALCSAEDVFSPLFAAAAEIAGRKGENGSPFSNETWYEAAVKNGIVH